MKVFEILSDNTKSVTEQDVIDRMKNFDWKYEFSDNVSRIAWGNRELELIENLVFGLWKQSPDRAVEIWNELSPASPTDKTIVPSFLLRLKNQMP